MAQSSFTKTFIMDLSADPAGAGAADQILPILQSQDFRRFTILIENAGAGIAELKGAVLGGSTRSKQSAIMLDGVLDHASMTDTGYHVINDAAGNPLLSGVGNGMYQVELTTHLPGGLILSLSGINGGGDMKVTVIMSGNVRLTGAPRGA